MPTEAETKAAADAIWESMQNEGWIPTFGVRREWLPRLIANAAGKALEAAERVRNVDGKQPR